MVSALLGYAVGPTSVQVEASICNVWGVAARFVHCFRTRRSVRSPQCGGFRPAGLCSALHKVHSFLGAQQLDAQQRSAAEVGNAAVPMIVFCLCQRVKSAAQILASSRSAKLLMGTRENIWRRGTANRHARRRHSLDYECFPPRLLSIVGAVMV